MPGYQTRRTMQNQPARGASEYMNARIEIDSPGFAAQGNEPAIGSQSDYQFAALAFKPERDWKRVNAAESQWLDFAWISIMMRPGPGGKPAVWGVVWQTLARPVRILVPTDEISAFGYSACTSSPPEFARVFSLFQGFHNWHIVDDRVNPPNIPVNQRTCDIVIPP